MKSIPTRTPVRLIAATSFTAICFTLGMGGTVVAQTGDIVTRTDGKKSRGKIVSISKNEVTIEAKEGSEKVPSNQIVSIAFSGEPSGMRQVRELVEGGQWESALERLAKIDSGRIENKRVASEVAYYKALATARKGDELAKAVRVLLDYVRNNKDSYHFFETVEVLGDLAMQLGSYQKAASYYAQLSKAPWTAYKLKGAFLEGTALQAQGPSQLANAVKKYDAVTKAKVSSADAARYKQLATAGKVACSVNQQNAGDSIKIMQELIANNDPKDAELFARAYNALGACYQAAGKPNEAIHQYLHVSLLFHRVDTAHAEALFHLSQLWGKVGKADRASETRKLLMSRYAGTVWAKR